MRGRKINSLVEALERVHLQWFSDPEEDLQFEPGEEEEVVVLRPGEEEPKEEVQAPPDPEKEELKRRVSELSARGDGAAIAESIAGAINKIQQSKGEEPIVQQTGETDEQFAKRLETEMFKPGGTFKALQEAVYRIVGPAWNQTIGATVQQSKSIMQLHPEKGGMFRKYEAEIEERRKRLPYQQRNSLDVYERLFKEVVADHAGEIDEGRIQEEVKKQVAATLKGMGIDPEKGNQTFTEGAGQRSSGAPAKKRVYITQADVEEAERKGMDPRDYVRYKHGR